MCPLVSGADSCVLEDDGSDGCRKIQSSGGIGLDPTHGLSGNVRMEGLEVGKRRLVRVGGIGS